MVASQEGYERLALTDLGGNLRQEMVAYASLPPFTMPGYVEDSWKIVIVVPEEEIFSALNQTRQQVQEQSLRVSLLSLVILVAILAFVSLVTVRFSTNATRDLRTLARAADGISAKNYDMELKLRSQDEIGQLGRAFETMSGEIREYTVNLEGKVAERTADLRKANDEISRLNDQLRGENLRLGAELDVARRLQLMVLPPEQETSNIPDLDIASFMRPADEVGGDYYDVLRVGETVYLGIGDVTGHGLPSGVIMLMAQTALLGLSKSGEKDMERMLSILNQVLYNNILRIHEDKNMTMAILKYRNREFSIVGQHESVLVCRQDGSLEVVDTMDLGMPIGLEEDIEKYIMTSQIKLQTGDTLLLYTDGVTEAFGRKKKQFGIDGLKNSLVRHHKMDARGVMEHILADLYVHIGEATIFDDIAILVIKQK